MILALTSDGGERGETRGETLGENLPRGGWVKGVKGVILSYKDHLSPLSPLSPLPIHWSQVASGQQAVAIGPDDATALDQGRNGVAILVRGLARLERGLAALLSKGMESSDEVRPERRVIDTVMMPSDQSAQLLHQRPLERA